MKAIFAIRLIFVLGFFQAQGQIDSSSFETTASNSFRKTNSGDTILHMQKVQREDVPFGQYFKSCFGILTLTNTEVSFSSVKPRNSIINFRLTYSEIISIKSVNILFLPNRFKIITKDGEKYSLFTYKRSKIIEIIKQRINNSMKAKTGSIPTVW